jgi:ribosome-associated protein
MNRRGSSTDCNRLSTTKESDFLTGPFDGVAKRYGSILGIYLAFCKTFQGVSNQVTSIVIMDLTLRDSEMDARGIRVNAGVFIPSSELEIRASRSGGPGGQHVNTSSTRVEVVWNVRQSAAIGEAQRERLLAQLASRLDTAGNIRIVSSETRSQRQNREIAEERLGATIRGALVVPKKRKKTKPTRGSVERRLSEKKKHSGKKSERRQGGED